MRAKYSALMAARYATLAKAPTVDVLEHYLYHAIFPKIGGAFIKGLTSVTIHCDLIPNAEEALMDLGYAITRREYPTAGQPSVVARVEVKISWADKRYITATSDLPPIAPALTP